MIFRDGAFRDLVRRQLNLWQMDNAGLIDACATASRRYDEAARDEAEERYAELLELVEEGTEALAAMRDAYAATLEDDARARYERAFHRAVRKRLPGFAADLEDT